MASGMYVDLTMCRLTMLMLTSLLALTPHTTARITARVPPSCVPAGRSLSRTPSPASVYLPSLSVSVRYSSLIAKVYSLESFLGVPCPATESIAAWWHHQAHSTHCRTLGTTLHDQSADSYSPSPSTDAYTIKAVGQEEFSDVKVPDAPAQKK